MHFSKGLASGWGTAPPAWAVLAGLEGELSPRLLRGRSHIFSVGFGAAAGALRAMPGWMLPSSGRARLGQGGRTGSPGCRGAARHRSPAQREEV